MALRIHSLAPEALELHIEGQLHKQDYEKLVPLLEQRIAAHGKINLLVHISELSGWTPAAMWQDLRFDAKHHRDVARMALVADQSWRRLMAPLSEPFTGAEVRFFRESDLTAARTWLLEGQEPPFEEAR